MGKKSVGRAVLLGGLVSAVAAACAQGGDLGSGGNGGGNVTSSTGTGTTTSGMPDGGHSDGNIGSPCKSNAECSEGTCVPIGNASYCTHPCPPECEDGTYCSIINGTAICVPDLDQQCAQCLATTDCKLPSDICLQAPAGDRFCARDCSVDGLCPNGFTCVDKGAYDMPDAGAPDGGEGAADGGPTPTTPFKWCVPNGGASCPCNDKREGVSHACAVTNASGTCGGMETCDGKQGKWQGCTAATPAAETCNGKDDNCDGMTDEGDPNMLCAGEGAQPPHASWACKDGACSLGACDAGWTSFPAGPVSDGCSCPLEAGEPNGTCGAATNAGSVSDTGAPITLEGTLSSPADVDFWTFTAVDTNEVTTNSFHVSITLTAPAPNDEFLMDVMRGDTCTDTPTGASTAITAYDWCVNATDGAGTGEAVCGATATPHCQNNGGKYYVRVYRKPGATATCTSYAITVSGGGGECDLSKKCP